MKNINNIALFMLHSNASTSARICWQEKKNRGHFLINAKMEDYAIPYIVELLLVPDCQFSNKI